MLALSGKWAWAVAVIGLLILAPAISAQAQGDPFDPAELQQLTVMEKQHPASSVSGGDYTLTGHSVATVFQIAFLLLPPFALGYAAARRRVILNAISRVGSQLWQPVGRRFARIAVAPDNVVVSLVGADDQTVCEGCLVDISKGGIGFKLTKGQLPSSKHVNLSLDIKHSGKKMQLSDIPAALAWAVGDRIGLQFERALSFSQETLAELFAPRELALATVKSR